MKNKIESSKTKIKSKEVLEIQFLRFGDWHESETSRRYRSGETIIGQEVGVSVFEIIRRNGRIFFLTPINEGYVDDISAFLFKYGQVKTPIYVVTGNIVGYGADSEPLLKNLKIVEDVTEQILKLTEKGGS